MPKAPFTAERPNPRHRFHAVRDGSGAYEGPYELALAAILGIPGAGDGDARTGEAVRAAYASYSNPQVRMLFDACLLSKATADDLTTAFGVDPAETEAYAHLFFDRSVFQNDFYVFGYIAEETDEHARALLKEAHLRGFRAIKFRYAADTEALAPETVLQQVLEANARQYNQLQSTVPINSKAVKDLRALGKQVVADAQALTKVSTKPQGDDDGKVEFVIKSGPVNPTIDELLARGAELAH